MEQTLENQSQQQQEKSNGRYFTHEHVLEAQKKKGRELPIDLVYDPKIFWDSIGRKFYENFNQRGQYQSGIAWLVDRLKVLKCETLLDCGTGFGRVLPFLLDAGVIKSAVGIDISEPILECSKEYLEPLSRTWCQHTTYKDGKWLYGTESAEDWIACPKDGILKPKKLEKEPTDFRPMIEMKQGDVRKLGFDSESFDCVMSFECLQHLSTEDMEQAVLEMTRVSKKVIICAERWAFPGERFEPHYFSHNLADEFRKLGLEVAQVSALGAGLQGVISIKKTL